ncbi:thermonuclease family protein (plasmid) [Rhizobium sp. C104]|uniref:thermonuclease family protein n=1 Tax=Rhizobium sp. C104 TaxID=2917727 RepID=UPI001EF83615|nr:thermonuclease family protein [Rhizobium sp. C104]ULJ82735.1 thermonuclease family protein [Rhizobium sp. C104]
MAFKRSKKHEQSRRAHAITRTITAVAVAFTFNSTPSVGTALAKTLTQAIVVKAVFRKCEAGNRTTCVVDGDTLWIRGEKIRVADIDTPEVSEPKCASELALGRRATDRLIELVNQAPFQFHAWPARDKDRYGRKLRVLIRNGKSLGNILVSEGLARTWSGRRQPWC